MDLVFKHCIHRTLPGIEFSLVKALLFLVVVVVVVLSVSGAWWHSFHFLVVLTFVLRRRMSNLGDDSSEHDERSVGTPDLVYLGR